MSGGGPPLGASELIMLVAEFHVMLHQPREQQPDGRRNAEGRCEREGIVGSEGDFFHNTEVLEEEIPRCDDATQVGGQSCPEQHFTLPGVQSGSLIEGKCACHAKRSNAGCSCVTNGGQQKAMGEGLKGDGFHKKPPINVFQ